MRPLVVLVALAMIAAFPAPAAGQAAGGSLLSDEKGDVVFYSGAPGAAPIPVAAGEASDSVDLLSLNVVELDEAVVFDVALATMGERAGSEFSIFFEWHGVEFAIEAFRGNPTFGNFAFASLYRSVDGDFERMGPLGMTVDSSKATAKVTLPKVFVLDLSEKAPTRGDTFSAIRAEAYGTTIGFNIMGSQPMRFYDQMPDEGEGAAFTLQLGDFASGHLLLMTEDRLRLSNGGATTFVFQAVLSNNASYEDEVTLELVGMPESWNGTIQSPVKVPPNSERVIAVLASVPFEHTHGGFDGFNVSAVSKKDPNSRATLRLGVLHTPIPQPAGHHSELYLHAKPANSGPFATLFPFSRGYFNTDSTHDTDAPQMDPNRASDDGTMWYIPLNPGLGLGVDMDLNRTGTIEGSILGRANGEAQVSAKLFLFEQTEKGNEEGLLLASGKPVTITLNMQTPATFKFNLNPTPDSDYVPYKKGQNLVLQVFMKSDSPNFCCVGGQTGPALMTKDFKMVLPLNEYHDQLTGMADVSAALDLKALGPVEKLARPGTLMTYIFDITNGANKEMRVDLDLAGNDARTGTVLPAGFVRLAAHETQRVTLGVRVPGDASEGKQIEVLLFAHATDDPSVMAIARTITTVTLGQDAADDETDVLVAAREAQNNTPTPGLVGLVGAIALAAIALPALRRRK